MPIDAGMHRRAALVVLAALLACAPPAPVPARDALAAEPTPRPPIRGTRLLPTTSDGVGGRVRVEVTGLVVPGDTATATAVTAPSASCTIEVTYASGLSEAQGLDPKTAGDDGSVSWTWIVGINTTPGSWPVDIACVEPDGRRTTGRTLLTVLGADLPLPTGSGEAGP